MKARLGKLTGAVVAAVAVGFLLMVVGYTSLGNVVVLFAGAIGVVLLVLPTGRSSGSSTGRSRWGGGYGWWGGDGGDGGSGGCEGGGWGGDAGGGWGDGGGGTC